MPDFTALGFESNDVNGSRTGNKGGILYSTSSALPYPERESGLVPYYDNTACQTTGDWNCSAAKARNGGLPQLANITAHVEALSLDIARQIPDQNSTGVYSFDWEFWWPVWEQNSDGDVHGNPPQTSIYVNKSIALVQAKHPSWTLAQTIAQAKDEFEAAAKIYFLETLRTAKQLRPLARWGFYNFPNCDGPGDGAPGVAPCSCSGSRNDALEWLYDEVTSLQPSIYVYYDHPENTTKNAFYAECQMAESKRVVASAAARGTRVAGELPIYTFVWPRYHMNHYDGKLTFVTTFLQTCAKPKIYA